MEDDDGKNARNSLRCCGIGVERCTERVVRAIRDAMVRKGKKDVSIDFREGYPVQKSRCIRLYWCALVTVCLKLLMDNCCRTGPYNIPAYKCEKAARRL